MHIYNTLSRKKELFTPLENNHVRMYVCGDTVYDYCHLGHARCKVAFDIVNRYLRNKGYKVTFVRNITDIDDKIIKRAAENSETIASLTERIINAMWEDYQALNILPPDIEPRATEFVDEMLSLIQLLVDKGYAYPASNGDVFFRVRHFKEYGKLSGKVIEELTSGARVEPDEAKEDPLDFVLWKKSKPGEPAWKSPWGEGRPGWHIECSAMCRKNLGDTFDIHGGGPDLKFPHHENEIAQSEAATGKPFAKIWMHAGALRMDNEKMSKSLGNFFTIREVLQRYHPETVRYFLLSSHYRSAINYSVDNLKEAEIRLERLYTAIKELDLHNIAAATATTFAADFYAAMDDDFNVPKALSILFELVRHINNLRKDNVAEAKPLAALLVSLGGVLGILQGDPQAYLQSGKDKDVDTKWIAAMIAKRAEAKKNRDFAEADRIRIQLAEKGIQLLDSREGTTWKTEKR